MEQEKVDFINKHSHSIIQEAVKYKDETGYLAVFVNEDFTINKKLSGFNPGKFDKKDFVDLPAEDNISSEKAEQLNEDVEEAIYVYFCLLWMGDETKHSFKKLTLLHSTTDYDKFKSS